MSDTKIEITREDDEIKMNVDRNYEFNCIINSPEDVILVFRNIKEYIYAPIFMGWSEGQIRRTRDVFNKILELIDEHKNEAIKKEEGKHE